MPDRDRGPPAPTTVRSPEGDLRQWVERYGDDLYRYALLRVADGDTARDLVQETLLAAVKGRFSGRSSPKTWLVGILKHKVADHFRRLARDGVPAPYDPEDEAFGPDGRWRTPPARWGETPDSLLGRKAFWEALQACLAEIPPRQAAAFSLRELEGQETEDVCKAFETNPTNVWVLLHRARMALRRCLERSGFGAREVP